MLTPSQLLTAFLRFQLVWVWCAETVVGTVGNAIIVPVRLRGMKLIQEAIYKYWWPLQHKFKLYLVRITRALVLRIRDAVTIIVLIADVALSIFIEVLLI